MLFNESAIKVVLSYEPGASRKLYGDVKLMPSGQGRGSSLHCPVTDVSNVEQVCDEVLDAINRAASNPNTREVDRFKFMGLVLEDQARVVWLQACTARNVDPLNPAVGNFEEVVKEFFNKQTHTTKMRDNILRYLEMGIKKPKTLNPIMYESRFRKIMKNAEYFNGIKPAPSDDEKKDWYLRSYPKAYQADYMKKGSFSTDDIGAITKHMTYLHVADEARGVFNEPKKEKKPKKERKSSYRSRDRGYDRRYKGDDRRSSKSSSSKIKEHEVPDDAQCPVHPDGKHTWSECSRNPANKKEDRNYDRKRDRKESHKGRKYDSHHLQHSDEESSHSDRESGEERSHASGNGSGSDSDSSSGRGGKRRNVSHHNDSGVSVEMENLEVVDGFDNE